MILLCRAPRLAPISADLPPSGVAGRDRACNTITSTRTITSTITSNSNSNSNSNSSEGTTCPTPLV